MAYDDEFERLEDPDLPVATTGECSRCGAPTDWDEIAEHARVAHARLRSERPRVRSHCPECDTVDVRRAIIRLGEVIYPVECINGHFYRSRAR